MVARWLNQSAGSAAARSQRAAVNFYPEPYNKLVLSPKMSLAHNFSTLKYGPQTCESVPNDSVSFFAAGCPRTFLDCAAITSPLVRILGDSLGQGFLK